MKQVIENLRILRSGIFKDIKTVNNLIDETIKLIEQNEPEIGINNKLLKTFIRVFNRQPLEHEKLFLNQTDIPEDTLNQYLGDFIDFKDNREKFNWRYFKGYLRGRIKDYEDGLEQIKKQKELQQSRLDRNNSIQTENEERRKLEMQTWELFNKNKSRISQEVQNLYIQMIHQKKYIEVQSKIYEIIGE